VFRKIICRNALDNEFAIIDRYYKQQLQFFKEGKLDAASTLDVGEYPQDNSLDKNTQAALMKTINLIYNMEEAIVKT
jgi:hypothetical protein